MTCALASKVVTYMSYVDGVLTLQFAKYVRRYQCDTITAHQLAYSDNPTKFFNQNIKRKLTIIN